MAQEANTLITEYSDFEASGVSYGAPKTNARGGKSIRILDSNKNTLILQTPLMLTWGAQKMVDDDTGRVSYSMSLQFPSEEYSNDEQEHFLEKVKEFENKVLDDCVTHAKEWFGKSKMSREVAEALFTPLLRYPKDKTTGEPDYSRAPTMKVKIPYWEGKFNVELYDVDGEPIFSPEMELGEGDFETMIPKTARTVSAIQCNGIWFAAGKFGVTWQLKQAVVKRPVKLQGRCFIKLSDSDKKQLDTSNTNEDTSNQEYNEDNTNVEDTDNEDNNEEHQEDHQEDEDIQETKPKKTKRRVVRKKATAEE